MYSTVDASNNSSRGSPILWILLIVCAYLVPGLTGHDPWKQDEAYTFGIIRNMVASGDLVVPRVAADPFMEKPPAFYITVYRLGLIGHGFA